MTSVLWPLLVLIALWGPSATTQNMIFHLLAGSIPMASFSTANQNFQEANGVWSNWPAGLNAWGFRRSAYILGGDTTLTDFPLLVKLDSTRVNYNQALPDGADLRITDDSGTALSFEIERWDPLGSSYVWVKMPSLPAYPNRTRLWFYYGNATATTVSNRAAPWDANYFGVWHFDSDAIDSTTVSGAGVATGATFSSGNTGRSYLLSGGAENVLLPGNLYANRNTGTLELWFKTTSTDVPLLGWATSAPPAGPSSHVPTFYIGTDGRLRGEQWYGSTAAIVSTAAVNDDQWHHIALTMAGTTQSLYLDGVLQGTIAGSIVTFPSTITSVGMAFMSAWPSSAGGWRSLNGAVDEIRFSQTVRDENWIRSTYLSAKDLLVEYGTEETKTSGAAPITVILNLTSNDPVSIPYTVTGTATIGADHTRTSGTVVIPAGMLAGSIDAQISRDDLVEGNETIVITLGTPVGADLGYPLVHTTTIIDETLSPPDAINDAVTITSLSPVVISPIANDTDANNDTLLITSFTQPTSGSVARVGSTLSFTPNGDFGATDSFTYTITDGRGGSDTATVNLTYQIPFTWLGAGTDNLWATPENWLGGAVPNASQTAYFNNQCTSNCDPLIAANTTVGGVQLNSSYTGTITQGPAATIDVNTAGWRQRAGNFVGSNASITSLHQVAVLGGTFQSTSATFQIGSPLTSRTIFEVGAGAIFTHNNGRLHFNNSQPGCVAGQVFTLNVDTTLELNDVTFYGDWASMCGQTVHEVAAGDTLIVLGELRHTGGHLNGAIELKGNLVTAGGFGGYGTITVNGTGAQTYSWTAGPYGSRSPSLIIDKSSGTFESAVGNLNLYTEKFLLENGTFSAPTGTLDTSHTAFSTTLFKISATSVYTDNGGAVSIFGGQPGCVPNQTFTIDVPDAHTFSSLTLSGNNASSCGTSQLYLVSGRSVTVSGAFSHTGAGGIHGTFNLGGNFVAAAGGGTAVINFVGTGNQSISATGTLPSGTMTINKPSGTLSHASHVGWSSSGQAVNVTNGLLNLSGFNLNVAGLLTVSSGGRILCNGGVVTAGSTAINGEVSCGSSIGITWTGLAGDGLWTTAGNWTNSNIPASTHIAFFNGICTGLNCNASINSSLTLRGLVMNSSYTGTITQNAGIPITVTSAGWSQAAGNFLGSNAAMTTSGPFLLAGGNFQATSGTWSNSSSITINAPAVFTHNSGTLNTGSTVTYNANGVTFNNLGFSGYGATITLVGTLTTLGTLSMSDTYSGSSAAINGGIIEAKGNINLSSLGKRGTTLIRISGNTDQTMSSAASGYSPALEINSSGGTVTLTGSILPANSFTYVAGNVDASASALTFVFSQSVTPGSMLFQDVNFSGYGATQTLSGTMTVAGTLSLSDTYNGSSAAVNGGTIEAKGNIYAQSTGKRGSTLVRVSGNSNQTVYSASGNPFLPRFEIASTGGTVTLAGSLAPSGSFTHLSGVVDPSTSSINFYFSQTITPNTMTFNSIEFGGYSAAQTIAGTVTATGTVTFSDTYNGTGATVSGGTIEALGNISVVSSGKRGTTTVNLLGTANRTVTSTAGYIPNLTINTTAGTTTMSGTLTPIGNLVHLAGNVDAGTSTMSLVTTAMFRPGTVNWNNLYFGGASTTTNLNGETAQALGTLSFDGSGIGYVNSGSIEARGNVSFTNGGKLGTANLNITGTTQSTLTASGSYLLNTGPNMTKTGGAKVSLATNLSLSGAGRSLTVTSGELDLNGYDLTVNSALSVPAGSILKCSGGEFFAGSTSLLGTIECPGFSTYPFNWTGNAADGNFATAGNWQGLAAPDSSSVVVFNDSFCGANCNATISSAANVKGIQLDAGYSGTLTQAPGATITIGAKSWIQAGGSFLGSNSAITINRNLNINGGSFQSTSANLFVRNSFTRFGGATFAHNNGSVTMGSNGTGATTVNIGASTLNDLTFSTSFGGNTITGTLNVLGNLLLGGATTALSSGTINVHGNFTTNLGSSGTSDNATVRIVGSTNQTISGTGSVPNLVIASTGGTVTLAGTITVRNSMTYSSGTFDAGTSTITLGVNGGGAGTINTGSAVFNNVVIARSFANTTITGNLNIAGNLTTSGSSTTISGGTIVLSGNLTSAVGGTPALTFTGTAPLQTVSIAGTAPSGAITVNKTSGEVRLTANTLFNGASQDLAITAGTFNMAGYNLTIGRNITNSGILRRGTAPTCGVLSFGGTLTGNAAICP